MSQLPPGFVLDRQPSGIYQLPPSLQEERQSTLQNRREDRMAGTDARNAANDAARIGHDNVRLQADLIKNGLRIGRGGQLEPIPNWRPPAGAETTAARTGALRDRVTAMSNLEATLREVEQLYNRDFKGRPVSRLGGLSEYVPGMFNQRNETFNSASQRLGPFIQSILGLSGKEADAAAEYERKVMPFIPRSDYRDETNESKINQLRGFLGTQRSATYRELGIPEPPAPAMRQSNSAVIRFDRNGNRIK